MLNNVIQLPVPAPSVPVQDFAAGLLSMQMDRKALEEKSLRLHQDQIDIMKKAMDDIAELSKQQEVLALQRSALDDAIETMLANTARIDTHA